MITTTMDQADITTVTILPTILLTALEVEAIATANILSTQAGDIITASRPSIQLTVARPGKVSLILFCLHRRLTLRPVAIRYITSQGASQTLTTNLYIQFITTR